MYNILVKIISKAKNNLGMVSTNVNPFKVDIKVEPTECRNELDSITKEIVDGINKEREGTKYHPVTLKGIAMKFAMHPATRKDITQRRYILAKCKEWGSYGKAFYYFTKIEKI